MRRRRRQKPGIADALPIDRGDRVELELGEFGPDGEVTATLEGVPVAVVGGLPGERVTAEVLRKYPERVACLVETAVEPSPDRIEAPCPYFGRCTGCQFQHLGNEKQLELKHERVARAFRPYPSLGDIDVRPTLASPVRWGYRNHARFTIGRTGEVGFVNRHSRSFVRVDRCMLMAPLINETLNALQGRLTGMTQMSVRVGVNSGERLVQPALIDGSTGAHSAGIASGGTHLHETLRGHRFRIAGSSFFQVNAGAAELVADTVGSALSLTGRELVVDAYAGVGVFAVLLAGSAREVIGIEDSVAAADDARANAAGLANVRFITGRAEAVLPTLAGVDAVVMDPPRRGCHPDALAALQLIAPARVAMVSCEPDALARDLDLLCAGGMYAVDWAQPVDMFPQTYHVECVAAVRRRAFVAQREGVTRTC